MVWDNIEYSYAAINTGGQSNLRSETAVLSIAKSLSPSIDALAATVSHVGIQSGAAACLFIDGVDLAFLELPVSIGESLPPAIIRQTGHDMLNSVAGVLANAGSDTLTWVSHARNAVLPKFSTAYRDVRALATTMKINRVQDEAALTRATIVGTVSTYNPYRDGKQEGDALTASGELYDPEAWTAAIQVDLRNSFGGIRYGRLYQPAYALVESVGKQVIVKVNDVGHLKPGRVLDLNERTMRYFDPFLTRGLLADARITLLPGEDWTPGPVGNANSTSFAVSGLRSAPAQLGPIVPARSVEELPRLGPRPPIQENVRAETRLNVGG